MSRNRGSPERILYKSGRNVIGDVAESGESADIVVRDQEVKSTFKPHNDIDHFHGFHQVFDEPCVKSRGNYLSYENLLEYECNLIITTAGVFRCGCELRFPGGPFRGGLQLGAHTRLKTIGIPPF